MAIIKVCKVTMQLYFRISCLMLLFLSEATNDLESKGRKDLFWGTYTNWYMFHNLRQGDSSDKRVETGSTACLGLNFNSRIVISPITVAPACLPGIMLVKLLMVFPLNVLFWKSSNIHKQYMLGFCASQDEKDVQKPSVIQDVNNYRFNLLYIVGLLTSNSCHWAEVDPPAPVRSRCKKACQIFFHLGDWNYVKIRISTMFFSMKLPRNYRFSIKMTELIWNFGGHDSVFGLHCTLA